jgi:hypothetical protein
MIPTVIKASDDLYIRAVKVGMIWHGMFSVPWKHDQFVCEADGKTRRVFHSKEDAILAAAEVVFKFLGDKTIGFMKGPVVLTKEQIDEQLRAAMAELRRQEGDE